MGLQAGIAGAPGGVRRKHLCHVGLCAAAFAGIVQTRCLMSHQFRRAHLSVGLGNGKLHRLVAANGTIKNIATTRNVLRAQ